MCLSEDERLRLARMYKRDRVARRWVSFRHSGGVGVGRVLRGYTSVKIARVAVKWPDGSRSIIKRKWDRDEVHYLNPWVDRAEMSEMLTLVAKAKELRAAHDAAEQKESK